jgi:pseudouridine-5'-phosphate glycosidase
MFLGLSTGELERLATLGTKAQKTARRDIAHVVSSFEYDSLL